MKRAALSVAAGACALGLILGGCQSGPAPVAGRKVEPGAPYGVSIWSRTFEPSSTTSEPGHRWCTAGVSIENQSRERLTSMTVVMKLTEGRQVIFQQDVALDSFVDQDTGEIWHSSQPRSFFKATGRVSVPEEVLRRNTGYWYDVASTERADTLDFSDPENIVAALRAERYEEAYRAVKAKPALATSTTESGHQAVHYAALSGDERFLEFLLANGADVDAKTQWGLTPASVTAGRSELDPNKALKAVQMLKDHGADLKIPTRGGRTTLDFAVKSGGLQLCRYLLSEGLDPNKVTTNWTTLYRAVSANRPDVVGLLLESGSKPNLPNKQGNTPMHMAAELETPDCLALMSRYGGDVNVTGADKTTPLHMAVNAGKLKCVTWLLSHGAKKNARCRYGTARDIAVGRNNREIVQMLDRAK
ncbi:MAG: ankyrin repeat domain-containing protein [Armatimonadetes bacterium]|nr:ankyrin repeat domain-containing protein [Armatimonadota bacterium]